MSLDRVAEDLLLREEEGQGVSWMSPTCPERCVGWPSRAGSVPVSDESPGPESQTGPLSPGREDSGCPPSLLWARRV